MFAKLQKEYEELISEISLIDDNVNDLLDSKMIYNGIPCYVTYHDIEENLINLHPEDGETWLSEKGKNLPMTFGEFDEKVKIVS